MNHKLLVLVPYRNRQSHLNIFVPYIHQALKSQNIEYSLVIIEQSEGKPFNRGLLLNSGFRYFSNNHDYICLHDIDMIGEPFDYSYSENITHLAARQKDRNYEEWYSGYIGGTTLFPSKTFADINGFSNQYWGWGCEDDDLRIRCKYYSYQINRRQCKYYQLPHKKSGWHSNHNDSTYKQNRNKLNNFEKKSSIEQQKIKILDDGIKQVDKYIFDSIIHKYTNYTLLWLKI